MVKTDEKAKQFADYITLLRQKFTDEESAFLKKTQGMSLQQLKIMLIIALQQPCTMGHIAKHMPMLSLSSVTVIVDKLVKQEFVKRARDEKDRRVVFVEFTTKGHELYKLYRECILKMSHRLMSQFTDQEQDEILSIYKRLSELK
ncbi:MAG: MarR family transcriptional regulator [Gammaproteobacteria bacterium]|nr:MarR family transcriptional regulator [Gammaproteobacteria bacterium]MCH9743850.1 MarR family transcriptional regulator [Gammaproteobacteria bacterium]